MSPKTSGGDEESRDGGWKAWDLFTQHMHQRMKPKNPAPEQEQQPGCGTRHEGRGGIGGGDDPAMD